MSTVAIELNDGAVRLVGAGGPIGRPIPGYALADPGRIRAGADAAPRLRLEPQRSHDRFWIDLDTVPLGRPLPERVTAADLAHAHLQGLWSGFGDAVERAILVVPGSFSDRQLGLTLGIARAVGIPVRGLVDLAVAAGVAAGPIARPALHLGVELHRAVLTELLPVNDQGESGTEAELSRGRVHVTTEVGLGPLGDHWRRAVAERFVHLTRFDPSHAGSSEQVLFDRIPGLLEELADSEVAHVEIANGGRSYRIEIDRGLLESAVTPTYDRLLELLDVGRGDAELLLVDDRAARLPGLLDRLRRELDVVVLAAGAAGLGAIADANQLASDAAELPFVVCLPQGADASGVERRIERSRATVRAVAAGSPPTHVLHGDRAYAIGGEPLVLGVARADGARGITLEGEVAGISRQHCSLVRRAGRVVVEDSSRYGTFLNGVRVSGEASLATGDRLRLGSPGVELLLITVDDDGAS